MTELLVVMVTAFLVIAAASVVGPRLRIAAPLVLVAIGVAASFLPIFASTHIEPEWILEGVLPPLLYSSAVSMPAMNFRRSAFLDARDTGTFDADVLAYVLSALDASQIDIEMRGGPAD